MSIQLARASFLITTILTPVSTLICQQSAPPQRVPQFENEAVKVWKTTVMPNAPLTMHTHDHARVVVALTGGTIKVINESGSSEVHEWETGKAYWLPVEQGKQRHADANQGSKPIEVMVVEIKDTK